jgi:hypothetical protein
MPQGMDFSQLIALLLPLVALQLGLGIFCAVKVIREGTANLNKVFWLLIVLFVNLFGPIAFLLFGRRKDR